MDLSVFIDESGDFGPCTQHSPYYIIVLVFHEQSHSIQTQLYHLKQTMKDFGFDEGHAIHSAPLIRKERDHQHLERSDRKKLFHALFTFIRHSDVSYTSFLVDKWNVSTHDLLLAKISQEVGSFIEEHLSYFQRFKQIIVYYDNGQKEITNLINKSFNTFLEAEVRKVVPSDYTLFQAADMLCTLSLLREKVNTSTLTKSEKDFFENTKKLKKNYLKPIERKKIH